MQYKCHHYFADPPAFYLLSELVKAVLTSRWRSQNIVTEALIRYFKGLKYCRDSHSSKSDLAQTS